MISRWRIRFLRILALAPCKSPREFCSAITLIRALLRGEQVDMHGDVIFCPEGCLGFKPRRAEISDPCRQQLPGAAGRWGNHGGLRFCAGSARFLRRDGARCASCWARRHVRLTARLNAGVVQDDESSRCT